jgi:NAD(P)-dependent dehydrogenase (short-subunit alcohol dehydrogenase family)
MGTIVVTGSAGGIGSATRTRLEFLLSPDASYVVGSLVFVDGGGDAAARPDDWPTGRYE